MILSHFHQKGYIFRSLDILPILKTLKQKISYFLFFPKSVSKLCQYLNFKNILTNSRNIRPLAALSPPLPIKKNVLQRAAISSFAPNLRSQCSPGAVYSCLRHLRPFLLYQPKKKYGGEGYNAARDLISRDIYVATFII